MSYEHEKVLSFPSRGCRAALPYIWIQNAPSISIEVARLKGGLHPPEVPRALEYTSLNYSGMARATCTTTKFVLSMLGSF